MAKKKKKLIHIKCMVCNQVNYYSSRTIGKEHKKHCKWCRKHTIHKESKKK